MECIICYTNNLTLHQICNVCKKNICLNCIQNIHLTSNKCPFCRNSLTLEYNYPPIIIPKNILVPLLNTERIYINKKYYINILTKTNNIVINQTYAVNFKNSSNNIFIANVNIIPNNICLTNVYVYDRYNKSMYQATPSNRTYPFNINIDEIYIIN